MPPVVPLTGHVDRNGVKIGMEAAQPPVVPLTGHVDRNAPDGEAVESAHGRAPHGARG